MISSLWITVAVVQAGAVAATGWIMWRRGDQLMGGAVCAAVGTIILAVNLAWFLTDGLAGRSPIHMRGGVWGFWLSSLTGVEGLTLGFIALMGSRRRARHRPP